MPTLLSLCPPILSCAEARELEHRLLGGDESREWKAMQSAGRAVAEGILRDAGEIGGLRTGARLLVLAGKGNNAGDALIAARWLLERDVSARADVAFAFGERALRPLAARAWRELAESARERVLPRAAVSDSDSFGRGDPTGQGYELCIDGVFGFQFRPPAEPRIAQLMDRVGAIPIRIRAAVDLPSAGLFRADFTYATGSVKDPLLESENAGRIRYLDLGFFDAESVLPESTKASAHRVLTRAVLDPLRLLRPARCDKRSHGHVFLLGGSRGYPGAILMSVEAAVRSGAGLVTAFVPESFAPAYASRVPEAIWVGWPETPSGGLALEGEHLLRERVARADALVIGPGLGREPETLALVGEIVRAARIPVLLDADALQRDIVLSGSAPRVVTPHAGEFKRIADDADLRSFVGSTPGVTVVLKGPVTRLCDGGPVFHCLGGGPVLARGGSGDILAGMIGTQLAQTPGLPLDAAARGVVWHACAAEILARMQGQVAVRTTQLLDTLGPALAGGGDGKIDLSKTAERS